MKPKYRITKEVQVGIYNSEYVARIYADKIIVVSPYIKWIGNTGGYAERKESIRNKEIVNKVLAEMEDDCDESAWKIIGRTINDDGLLGF